MSLTCKQVTELLHDYIDGAMPCEKHRSLEGHLRDCPPCEAFLASYRETIRLTGSLPCDELPEELIARLESYLTEQLAGE